MALAGAGLRRMRMRQAKSGVTAARNYIPLPVNQLPNAIKSGGFLCFNNGGRVGWRPGLRRSVAVGWKRTLPGVRKGTAQQQSGSLTKQRTENES